MGWLFLALSLRQRGALKEAGALLEKAEKWRKEYEAEDSFTQHLLSAPVQPWVRRLQIDLLLREVKQQLGPKK